ncbi:MAG: sulfotransferase [Acidobacteriota bacterium]
MITFLKNFYRAKKFGQPIVVVSGLPRSGTSMTMKMLEAGGMRLFTDNIREADEDNPKGYYEFERVKNLHKEKDKSWLGDARGKVIKIISELLMELPDAYFYKLIFMDRHLDEVIASQNKMLIRRGESVGDDNERMKALFEKHLRVVKSWLDRQSNFDVIRLNYKEVIDNPFDHAERIRNFLGTGLDVKGMAGVVDEKLYRHRR